MLKPNDAESIFNPSRYPVIIFSAIRGIIVSIVLVLVFSLFLWLGFLPDVIIWVLGIIAAIAGAFVAGFLCVRRLRWKALIIGIITGVVFFLLLYIIGAILFVRISPGLIGFITYLVMSVCGSAFGAIAAISMRQRIR